MSNRNDELNGFVEMPDLEYFARPELSKSDTDKLNTSPSHYRSLTI